MSERAVFANDLPYSVPQEDPVESLKTTLAFSADDWGSSRAMAWVYGIVLGWSDGDDDPDDAYVETAARFGWTDEQVDRLKRLHGAFDALAVVARPKRGGN